MGIWHSHPYNDAWPSERDERGMATLTLPVQNAPRRALLLIVGGRPKQWRTWLAEGASPDWYARVTELAERALISRSGMSRRVARLVDEGLVRRDRAGTDARGVVVALTEAGIARLGETAPVHARGISKLFVAQLDDQELGLLERALNKVIVDCSFG